MYVAQGTDSSLDDVTAKTAGNLDAMWNVITPNEGADTGKQMWISEYGWQADDVGADGQAARMQTGFDAMRTPATSRSRCTSTTWTSRARAGACSTPAARAGRAPTCSPRSPTPIRPDDGARIASVQLPALAPGQTGEAIVTIENRGTATWSDGFRLGAASGCPDAWDTNEVAWTPDPAAGYANGPTDARVYLPADVAPGVHDRRSRCRSPRRMRRATTRSARAWCTRA